MGPSEAEKIVQQATGSRVAAVKMITHGRNSRVFRVDCDSGKSYAVKFYPQPAADGSNRLDNEWRALKFMQQVGINNIPRPISCNKKMKAAIYSYIHGTTVVEFNKNDINELLSFLHKLKRACGKGGASRIPPAAEACFSGAQLELNLRTRLRRLRELTPEDNLVKEMHRFLDRNVEPQMTSALKAAVTCLPAEAWYKELPEIFRTLSPSDFGFHNALRTENGLNFVDFEYFGHDDPVKATCDFLLHPAMEPDEKEMRFFYTGMLEIFKNDHEFEQRFKSFLPFFHLKWITIMLNEFLHSGLERRRFAAGKELSGQDLRKIQLEKATDFLNKDQQIMAVLFGLTR